MGDALEFVPLAGQDDKQAGTSLSSGIHPTQATSAPAFRDIICAYPWPCEEALAVQRCEGSDEYAVGSAGERGLFQIHPIHAGRFDSWDDAFIPEENVRVAYDLYADYGSWWHWRFSRACHGY